MSDLIDRNLIAELVDSHMNVHWEDIAGLPSEQPDVRTQMSSADCISRQAAIEAFDCTNELIVSGEANARNVVNYINKVVGKIKDLPSAQPEHTMEEFMCGQDVGNPEDGSL